jgi:hypothetical protein
VQTSLWSALRMAFIWPSYGLGLAVACLWLGITSREHEPRKAQRSRLPDWLETGSRLGPVGAIRQPGRRPDDRPNDRPTPLAPPPTLDCSLLATCWLPAGYLLAAAWRTAKDRAAKAAPKSTKANRRKRRNGGTMTLRRPSLVTPAKLRRSVFVRVAVGAVSSSAKLQISCDSSASLCRRPPRYTSGSRQVGSSVRALLTLIETGHERSHSAGAGASRSLGGSVACNQRSRSAGAMRTGMRS